MYRLEIIKQGGIALSALAMPFPLTTFTKFNSMTDNKNFYSEELIKSLPDFTNHYAEVNGTKLHYVIGGHGEPLILIPGYPETWWAYHRVMPILAKKYRVIVVDIKL